MKCKIAIVDDNLAFANHLSKELAIDAEVDNVGVFESGKVFLNKLNHTLATDMPQIVLMDISMETEQMGIEITKILKAQYPAIQVIMLTLHEEDDLVFEAFKVGAVGYLLKDEKIDFIIKAIKEVCEGGSMMSATIARKTIHFLQHQFVKSISKKENKEIEKLSERELEILGLMGKGYTYQKVADELFISIHTVKTHINNIFKKLRVSNKIDALRKQDHLF
jgi:DNA-binding NarL/FixJ family response regulator